MRFVMKSRVSQILLGIGLMMANPAFAGAPMQSQKSGEPR